MPKTIEEIEASIELMTRLGSEIRKEVNLGLENENTSLEERWRLLTSVTGKGILPMITTSEGHILNQLDNRLTMYDHFYKDRGQAITFASMYDTMQNLVLKGTITSADIVAWREHVLTLKAEGFINDW